MIADLRAFLRALTLLLHALVPWIEERVSADRRARREAEYHEQIRRGAEALAKGDPDGVAAVWSAWDDGLRAEGIAPDLDGGEGGSREAQ